MQMENDYAAQEKWQNYAENNDRKTFMLLFEKDFPEMAGKRYEQNDAFFVKMFNDADMMREVMESVGSVVYERLRRDAMTAKRPAKANPIESRNKLSENDDNIVMLPLVGEIAAGHEHFMDEDIEEYIPTPRQKLDSMEPGKYFYLRVSGDSMIGADIHDGDIVLIRRTSNPKNGDIVAAITDGETATLKTLHVYDDHVELRPENPEFDTIKISMDRFIAGTAGIIGALVFNYGSRGD